MTKPNLPSRINVAGACAALMLAATTLPGAAQETAVVAVTRAGSQPSVAAPAQNFTGTVRIDAPFKAAAPARSGGAIVTFEPGARTAWHSHPLGQTLIVLSGAGWVQQWGQARQEIKPGDTVWIPAGAKHWHGATSTTAMSHLAIAEALDGKTVEWLEQVSDQQYLR